MEKFNLRNLGVNYTVLDQDTQETETICVVSSEELKSIVGEFVGTDYTKVGPHIAELLKGFKGFAPSPYHITWYATKDDNHEHMLRGAISAARREGNKVVVTEILPSEELDTGFKRQ